MPDPNEAQTGSPLPDDYTVDEGPLHDPDDHQDLPPGDAKLKAIAERLETVSERHEAIPDQVVEIRAMPRSTELALVVERAGKGLADGGFEGEELVPRHTRQVTLKAGDRIHIVPLGDDVRDSMLLAADLHEARLEEAGAREANDGGQTESPPITE